MVAYSFNRRFIPGIEGGTKRQTIRAEGKRRHARPGEPMQIYFGMRTRHARKIIADPVCVGVDKVEIVVSGAAPANIAGIVVNGVPLPRIAFNRFAITDGFASIADFGAYWFETHGEGRFHGVMIRWEDR